MEKLGSSIEDSLFGRAVCFLAIEKMDLVREIQSQLRAELSEAVRILVSQVVIVFLMLRVCW